MTEKTYVLRPLCADDIFPMFQIISKIGIKEFKTCFSPEFIRSTIASMSDESEKGEAKDTDSEDDSSKDKLIAAGFSVAVDVACIVVSNIEKCRDDIYNFLSGLSGMNKKELAALPMATFLEMIIDVIKKEEFKDFFQVASRLFK